MNSFMMDIKNNSNDLHAVAEKTGFLKRLLEGKASTESYAEYLYNLYEVYNAIEVNLEKCKDNKVVKDFVLPEIYRAEAILKDLKFLQKGEENYLGIACSIILSRYAYLQYFNNMSRSLKMRLPRGNSNSVDAIAIEVAKKYGPKMLNKVTKTNMTNYKRIKDLI